MNNERKYVGKLSGLLNNPKKELNNKQDKMKSVTASDMRIMNDELQKSLNDPYWVGVGSFLLKSSGWDYTLDDTDDIITLNYCNPKFGTEITVYANYEINGKRYKTQLANNIENGRLNEYMFNGAVIDNCKKITSIVFSKNLDTSNLNNIEYMFGDCTVLKSLDLTMFDTSNITTMNYLFRGCQELEYLDLSSFDTSKVTSMGYMFARSENLTEILVSRDKWVIPSGCNTNGMFSTCGVDHVTYVD